MTAEIISIGTELLLGNIVNTNAQYISKKLAFYGIDLYYQTVVGDNPARIKSAVDIAFSRADLVITTGGLGPTKDDLTKEILAEYMGYEITEDAETLARILKREKALGIEHPNEGTLKQALVPKGAIILKNDHGTAPGSIMERDGKRMLLLPGPPKEMIPMFDSCCETWLRKLSDHTIVSLNIYVVDFTKAPVSLVGESQVANRLAELLDLSNPSVATYAKPGSCLVRITAAAPTHDEARALIEPVLAECRSRIGEELIREVREEL